MQFRYDKDAVSPEQQLRRFRAMVDMINGDNIVNYRFGDGELNATVRGRMFGDILIATTATSSHSLRFTPRSAGARASEILVFALNSGGRLESVQGRREAKLDAGDGAFVSQASPFSTISGCFGHRTYLYVPKCDLAERLGKIDDLAAKTFSAKLPAQSLATRYFARLGASQERLDAADFERKFAEGLDLLAFAMQDQLGGSLSNTTVHRSALRIRLKSLILSRLEDPEFSLAEAAAVFGVSPRYVNNLLADDGTSFGRFLLERRLLVCRRTLGDPRFSAIPIIDIAFRWGFNDAAHFSRTFKTRFGLTPRDYQRATTRRGLEAEASA